MFEVRKESKSPCNNSESGGVYVSASIGCLVLMGTLFGLFDLVRISQTREALQTVAAEATRFAMTGQVLCQPSVPDCDLDDPDETLSHEESIHSMAIDLAWRKYGIELDGLVSTGSESQFSSRKGTNSGSNLGNNTGSNPEPSTSRQLSPSITICNFSQVNCDWQDQEAGSGNSWFQITITKEETFFGDLFSGSPLQIPLTETTIGKLEPFV